jgi:hypothetical protein
MSVVGSKDCGSWWKVPEEEKELRDRKGINEVYR